MPQRVEISYKTIVFTVLFLLGLWLLFLIKDILLSLFVSFIFMSSLRPTVEKLAAKKVPRGLAIGIIYLIIIVLLFFVGRVIFPPLVTETARLIGSISSEGGLPIFYQEVLNFFKNLNFDAFNKISPYGGNVLDIFKTVISVFNSIVGALGLFVFTFYLLLERKNLGGILRGFLSEEDVKKAMQVTTLVEERLGSWVRAQVLLCVVIGLMAFVGLSILKIPYALPLAILAAVFEIVPIIGPIISGIPAVLVALLFSPGMALVVILLYFLIHQAENNLIVPTIMRTTVGLSPVITIVALMVGGKLMGITGAILSIPVVLVVQTLIEELLIKKT